MVPNNLQIARFGATGVTYFSSFFYVTIRSPQNGPIKIIFFHLERIDICWTAQILKWRWQIENETQILPFSMDFFSRPNIATDLIFVHTVPFFNAFSTCNGADCKNKFLFTVFPNCFERETCCCLEYTAHAHANSTTLRIRIPLPLGSENVFTDVSGSDQR